MGTNLFTYGSLVVPAVMEVVTGTRHRDAPARLDGFDCFLLEGRVYPGIVASRQGSTLGRIYYDIEDAALERLDFYEADEYVRERVEVELVSDAARARRISAFTYVIPPSHRQLLSTLPWDEAKFVAEELESFLTQARGWMADYERRPR